MRDDEVFCRLGVPLSSRIKFQQGLTSWRGFLKHSVWRTSEGGLVIIYKHQCYGGQLSCVSEDDTKKECSLQWAKHPDSIHCLHATCDGNQMKWSKGRQDDGCPPIGQIWDRITNPFDGFGFPGPDGGLWVAKERELYYARCSAYAEGYAPEAECNREAEHFANEGASKLHARTLRDFVQAKNRVSLPVQSRPEQVDHRTHCSDEGLGKPASAHDVDLEMSETSSSETSGETVIHSGESMATDTRHLLDFRAAPPVERHVPYQAAPPVERHDARVARLPPILGPRTSALGEIHATPVVPASPDSLATRRDAQVETRCVGALPVDGDGDSRIAWISCDPRTGEIVPYDVEVAKQIEEAYKAKKASVQIPWLVRNCGGAVIHLNVDGQEPNDNQIMFQRSVAGNLRSVKRVKFHCATEKISQPTIQLLAGQWRFRKAKEGDWYL